MLSALIGNLAYNVDVEIAFFIVSLIFFIMMIGTKPRRTSSYVYVLLYSGSLSYGSDRIYGFSYRNIWNRNAPMCYDCIYLCVFFHIIQFVYVSVYTSL